MERKIRIVNEYGAFSAIEINKAYVECREYIKHYKEVIEKQEKKISELESELAVKEDLLKTVAKRYDNLLLDSLCVTGIDEDINCGEEPLPFSSEGCEKCSEEELEDLRERHQQDCIAINQLQTTIDTLVDRYAKLREMRGCRI